MSTNPSNPFVLPGLGQAGEAASNPLFASIEMMRQAFAGLAGHTTMGNGLPLGASLDPAELERRINELKTVENWLKLNLSMLSSTIQGMEVQLATIHTLKSFVSSAMGSGSSDPARSPLEVVLGLRPHAATPAAPPPPAPEPEARAEPEPEPQPEPAPQPSQGDAAASASSAGAKSAKAQGAGKANAAAPGVGQVPAAAHAWWNLLQQQFGQVAAATAATMAAAPGAAAKDSGGTKSSKPRSGDSAKAAAKPRAAAKKSAARKSTRSSTAARKSTTA